MKCSVQTQPGQTVVLPDEACHTVPKPATNIICKRTDCPKWIVSDWGSCSPPDHQDCGYRTRSVHCMLDGEEAADCCEEQPIQAQPCLPCGMLCLIQLAELLYTRLSKQKQNKTNKKKEGKKKEKKNNTGNCSCEMI